MRRLLTAFTILLLAMTSCSPKNNNEDISFAKDIFAMDTYMSIRAFGENAEAALEKAKDEIVRLEGLFSVTSEKSDISALNRSAGKSISVSGDTAKIIRSAVEMGDLTGGALDISLYPVIKEWGFTTGAYRIPEDFVIDALLENVDYKNISVTGSDVFIPEGYCLDLGAVAKGYTSDSVIRILKESGVKSAVISLGGNVHTVGKKTDGTDWKVGIINPFADNSSLGIVEISDKAVITSGNYERYFIGDDGVRYSHIISPADGRPVNNGLVSVTVIGENGAQCDSLSTALMVMGKEKAKDFWYDDMSFDMILVSDDNTITITEGIGNRFTSLTDMETELLTAGDVLS